MLTTEESGARVAAGAAVGCGAKVTACGGVALAVTTDWGAPTVASTGLAATVGTSCAMSGSSLPAAPTKTIKKAATTKLAANTT